mgnify:CR=1 FL=1
MPVCTARVRIRPNASSVGPGAFIRLDPAVAQPTEPTAAPNPRLQHGLPSNKPAPSKIRVLTRAPASRTMRSRGSPRADFLCMDRVRCGAWASIPLWEIPLLKRFHIRKRERSRTALPSAWRSRMVGRSFRAAVRGLPPRGVSGFHTIKVFL